MLNSAVSDFSAKMSKHFHSNSVMPLSEANLSRHTLQSPASREAKLKHILVYVDLQRELIALAEDEGQGGRVHHRHRTVREKSATISTIELTPQLGGEAKGLMGAAEGKNSRGLVWYNNNSNTPPKRSDLAILSHNSPRHEQPHASSTPQQTHERQPQEQQQHKQHRQSTEPSSHIVLRHHDSGTESLRQQRQLHQQQQERNTRQTDALDPSLALPRALPRNRMPEYRDSYISVGDLDTEWQIIDNVGPDSPTIPNSHYPAFEFAPGHSESRHALPIQASKSGGRPIQYRRREDSAEDAAMQRQALHRQTSFEKEKKMSRFGRFSLPGRSKRASTNHQRKESLPEMTSGKVYGGEEVHARSYSVSNKDHVRFLDGAAALDVHSGVNMSGSMVKRRSKVRQLLNDIFKKTPKHTSQVISVPSPVRRAYPGSGHNILASPSITPQNLPPRAGTSLSHYARESMVDPLQRELYHLHTPPVTQERLVLDDRDDKNNNNDNNIDISNDNNDDLQDDADAAETPFVTQTSLTPPPAASVLRYSASRPINLDQILSFTQGTAGEDSSDHKTRPSSNLMPLAGAIKELGVTGGATSAGASDPYTSQRRLVALTPEQPADLEGVGCRQNTFSMDSPSDSALPPIATA